MMNQDPTGPGVYWARTEENGSYDVILFITGKVPFLRKKTAVSFPDGDELRGSFYIGPMLEPLCIDEPVAAEGEVRREGE